MPRVYKPVGPSDNKVKDPVIETKETSAAPKTPRKTGEKKASGDS